MGRMYGTEQSAYRKEGPRCWPTLVSLQPARHGRRQETLTPAGRRPGEEVKFE